MIRAEDNDVLMVLASPPALARRGDHIRDLAGVKKGCQPCFLGKGLDRQGALCFAETSVQHV